MTANLYWSMFESGLGLIAVCLPTFRALFGQHSLRALIEMSRSAFSLHSWTRGTGAQSKDDISGIKFARISTKHFQQEDSTHKHHVYCERTDDKDRKGRVPSGRIHVQRNIAQVEDWA